MDVEIKEVPLLIVGGGPAGLSASIYAARAGIQCVVVERMSFGGQLLTTDAVDNYPGSAKSSGFDLAELLRLHSEIAGADQVYDEVTGIERLGNGSYRVTCEEHVFVCRVLIIATGAKHRLAGFAHEEAFAGRGVSYCATCDGPLYKGKTVYVVGGGTSACEDALYLARLATKVIMVVRKDRLKALPAIQDLIAEADNIEVRYNTTVASVDGNMFIERVTLFDAESGEDYTDTYEPGKVGVFVLVGLDPEADLVKDVATVTPYGIETQRDMGCSVPGLYAAGDVRDTVRRQIVTAAADGAVAALSAIDYLQAEGV